MFFCLQVVKDRRNTRLRKSTSACVEGVRESEINYKAKIIKLAVKADLKVYIFL